MNNHDYLYFFDGQWFESDALGQLCPTSKRPELGIPDDVLPCGTLDCCNNTEDLLDN